MFQRMLTQALIRHAADYPVVTVTGPRQAGKTTLVRACFPDHGYVNLEHPELRRLAEEDPKAFFHAHPAPLIIDEVQRVPELLSWIQVMVDEHPRKGAFILTGSHQFRLHHGISQSLAGRTSLLRLLPLSLAEMRSAGIALSKEEYLYRGCMPRIHHDGLEATAAHRNYFQTYVERDVRELIQIRNLRLFETFLKLLAARVGQTLNLHALAGELGVSSPTLAQWLSILEASYVIHLLPPYYRNFGKRLTKSPKLYFLEPGLAAWLLGITSPEQALRDPLHGGLFENLVVVEALKARLHRGLDADLYFWRDSNGKEVDLLMERQRRLIPIEIKSAMTWNRDFTKGLDWFRKNIPDAEPGHVIYAGDQEHSHGQHRSWNYLRTAEVVTE